MKPTPAEELHELALAYQFDLAIGSDPAYFAGPGKLAATAEDVLKLFEAMWRDLEQHPAAPIHQMHGPDGGELACVTWFGLTAKGAK